MRAKLSFSLPARKFLGFGCKVKVFVAAAWLYFTVKLRWWRMIPFRFIFFFRELRLRVVEQVAQCRAEMRVEGV
jgi:hypothetical protein